MKTQTATPLPIFTPQAKVPISGLEVHKRPVRTYYYTSAGDRTSDYISRSRASTLHNAIRAAIMHVLQKTAAKAEFYNEDGVRIGWVRRTTPSKIEVMHTNFTH
jgi:hypothetical protein